MDLIPITIYTELPFWIRTPDDFECSLPEVHDKPFTLKIHNDFYRFWVSEIRKDYQTNIFMKLSISISALPTADGRFLPKFTFLEWGGNHVTTIPYHFKDTFETKEGALNVAKVHAIKQAKESYGVETEVMITVQD